MFAIPGDIEAPTGGYGYDRRLLRLLPSYGLDARHVALPASFPNPSEVDLATTERLLAATPADARLLIDGLAYGAMPADLIQRLDRRIIALIHHPLAFESGTPQARREALLASERAALALARRVVVTSEATRRTLIADYGVAEKSIVVAEPGTDPAARATGTGMPMQLLAVGAVSPRKGYDVLVAALARLPTRDWRLTIAGALDRDPETVGALKAQISAARLDDRITLAGTVVPATLERFYESADVFVMPSRYEGYGMVLGEAMARGLAIVCTTGGAAAETVPDGAAIKVRPDDDVAFANAIAKVIGDNKLRKSMRQASWETGRTLPTWNETARRVAAAIVGIHA
ncbi:MAG: glycosyltransferase family 4 protein [Hyphomicrobiaceae bacterium]|nr:glycosyltransferase family 4 protein [Hyphomicrobiaceae bacterium]